MPAERPMEPWEEAHRRGQDLADRLAQGFNGLLHSNVGPHHFPWGPPHQQKVPFDLDLPAAAAALDIGGRLGRAGAELGACVSGVAQHLLRRLPAPFRPEEAGAAAERRKDVVLRRQGGGGEFGFAAERFGGDRANPVASVTGRSDEADEEGIGFELGEFGHFRRPQGSINITSTYDSRTHEIGSSFVAKGDLWRVEVSHGGSASGNENSPLTLVQLGPILFIRDSTLLLPVHFSNQRLLWYGYDRKNGMHSLCPALWSEDRRWLLMSMICLNPPACSFMDMQFPNGHLTFVAGEGLAGSAFAPVFGGLLQAQGRYPGETRISFSCQNKRGTRITPMVKWPGKSFSLGVAQAIAWRRSGLMVRPSLQFSLCPTFGNNSGIRAELIHSVKEDVSLICGGSWTAHPSVFASLSLGRSKWNGQVGSSGIVFRVEKPLSNIGRPSLSIQLNGGFEF